MEYDYLAKNIQFALKIPTSYTKFSKKIFNLLWKQRWIPTNHTKCVYFNFQITKLGYNYI